MFLNTIIRDRRKQMGLNQSELAQGICTQATMSNIENKGTVPSLTTLISLCKRLDLSLNDVVSDFRAQEDTDADKFVTIERQLATGKIEDAAKMINRIEKKISKEDVLNNKLYQFLAGYTSLLQDDLDGAIFHFNFVTDGTKNDLSMRSIAANICLGQIYLQKDQLDRAGFYFDAMFDELLSHKVTDEMDLFWLKTCVNFSYKFYTETGKTEKRNRLMNSLMKNDDYQISGKYVTEFEQYAAK